MNIEQENKKRIVHNMVSSLCYNLSVVFFGLILPRLYLTSFGSEINGLDSTIKQIFSCLSILEAGVGLAAQQAYYHPVAVRDRDRINGIFAANCHYYQRTGYIYLAATLAFALIYPFCIQSALSWLTVCLIIIIYGMPGVLSYFVQGRYRSFMEVEGKAYVITYITTVTIAIGNFARMAALLFTDQILLVQVTYCIPSLIQVLVTYAYMKKHYPWLNRHVKPDLEALSKKNSVLLHQVSQVVFNNTDTILISSLCGLAQASVYTIYMLFFSNIQKLFYSVTNSMSFRLGQIFHTDRERFVRYYDLYEALYIMLSFALFTVVAAFLLPIIMLYTRGVTDADYYSPVMIVLFTIVNLLSCAKNPGELVITYSGHFDKTQHQAVIEMVLNIAVSIAAVLYWGIAGCLVGTSVALCYRYLALTIYANKKVLDRSSWGSIRRFGINGILCAVILCYRGFNSCYANSYILVCLKGALQALWILPVFLLANAIFERQNAGYLVWALKKKRTK